MKENTYQKWNIILGWIVFGISLVTYTLTLEPTVSFWDCGEYISTSVKLEVGHPPGAPLFQMLGAFFAMFSSSSSNVAYMVNFMSGLASAFTILFMFWSLTNLIKRVAIKKSEFTTNKAIAILGSAFVGSLTYTFSDSFWFSAVEAEVYAMSSFLMALLFWLGLKWESAFAEPRGNKWLILISLVIGLSFGVHILSLLVIPSIVFIYLNHYYKKYNTKNFIIANIIAVGALVFIFKFLFPFTLKFFSISELFFINNLGLPFNSGTIIAGLVIIAAFYFGLNYTKKNKKYLANTALLSILFVMIGFSCWLMLPIRSNTNTTINENNPASARELLAYYNREQYGDANIFYDTYYSSKYDREPARDANGEVIMQDVKPKYEKDLENGKYIIVNDYKNAREKTSDKHKGFIPRMVMPASEPYYKSIAGIPEKSREKPTFGQNITFMAKFQFGYMYFRYLFWNFIGKQNDEQGRMDPFNGNWMSGIKPIDNLAVGISQDNLPDEMKNNKGRNLYFGIPFILGIIGLIYQSTRNKRNFYNLLLFFAFTGFAIIFYTNPKPFEPRERDYAIVGSFYIFAMWVGFGVYAIFEKVSSFIKPSKAVAILIPASCLLVSPLLMASQNWDDHDRSNKYTAFFNAKAYLDSCDKNAILFTIGDNDTFPLWYMQEVEGYRTDIKIINTSLLATDWYIDQMKRKTYDAPPIPSQLTHKQYRWGTLDVAYHTGQLEGRWDIKDFMTWISSPSKKTYLEVGEGKFEKFYPTNKLRLNIDKEAVLKNGIVKAKDSALIVDHMDLDVDERGLTKNRILMLDILANNNWERPIYFTGGSNSDDEYLWLKDHLQLDGLAFQLVPIKTPNEYGILGMGRIDSDKLYEQIKSWDFGHHGKDFYVDNESRKNSISYRNNISRLVEALINEGKLDKAEEILDISFEKLPIEKYQQYGVCLGFPEQYYLLNRPEKARKAADLLLNIFQQKLLYFSKLTRGNINYLSQELDTEFRMYQTIAADVNKYEKDTVYKEKVEKEFIEHIEIFEGLLK
ncbi:glycosyltransferase family 117 protein [Wenyingzhuangia sp. IMCC45574]